MFSVRLNFSKNDCVDKDHVDGLEADKMSLLVIGPSKPKKVSFNFPNPTQICKELQLCVDLGIVEIGTSKDKRSQGTAKPVTMVGDSCPVSFDVENCNEEEKEAMTDSMLTKEEMVNATLMAEKDFVRNSGGHDEEVSSGDDSVLKEDRWTNIEASDEAFVQAIISIENLFSSMKNEFAYNYSSVEEVSVIDKLAFEEELVQATVPVENQISNDYCQDTVGKDKVVVVRDCIDPARLLKRKETKLGMFDNSIIRLLGGDLLTRGIGVEADGASEGLLTLWNENILSVKSCISSKRCIILEGELLGKKKELIICNIYAANVEVDRKELWDYILNVQSTFSLPWCLGGDFNMVLDPSERKGVGCDMGSLRILTPLC
ncbi:hypothetical protein Dsin_007811 [Dipteronia sinensis]|uniref:Uncharacterized protein n=1 Tax=Dipteronia sinensis TaxID=43782 RepID=A0AAE0EH71_9ROSI|nr:hypothetical protein Dsin_007811 [Dipteronia sinensis]